MSPRSFLVLTGANIKMVLRDRGSLFWLFLFPAMIMLVFGFIYGSTGDVILKVGLVDLDRSPSSAVVTGALEGVEALDMLPGAMDDELEELSDGNRSAVLVIEEGFGEALEARGTGRISLYVDRSDITMAEITSSTLRGVLERLGQDMSGAPVLIAVDEKAVEAEDFEYMDFLTPGILAMTLLFGGVMGFSLELVRYREKGILRRMKVSPLSMPGFLASGILTVLLVAVAQAALLLLVGTVIFGVRLQGNPFTVAFVIVLGSVSFLSLGFLISSLARNSKTAEIVAEVVAMPMLFLSGIFFSLEWAPSAISVIARALPLYYLAEALREVLIKGGGLGAAWQDLVVLGAFGAACFLLSVKFFRWE